MELLNPWQVPFEGCDGIGHFKVCNRQLVASTLIACERSLRAGGRRLREQFGVDERICDAVGRKRILEVTGIPYECPAGSERLSKESCLSRKPAVLFNPFRLFHNRRQVRRAFPQYVPVSSIRTVSHRLVEPPLWNRGKYASQPVIGRNRAGAHTGVVIPMVAVEPRARPVAEDNAGRMTTGSIAFRADETRDRRTDTVGADQEFSRNLPLPIMTISEANTADATVVRADQIDELRFEHDRCTGLLRGIDKQPVNDSTPRCV